MIQEFKTSKGEFLGVLVPDDFESAILEDDGITIWQKEKKGSWVNYKSLPKGQYKIIGIQTEITEEQAKEIVDSDDDYGVVMYQNYATASMQYCDEQLTSLESFNSLMQKLEIKPDTKTLIIQKIK